MMIADQVKSNRFKRPAKESSTPLKISNKIPAKEHSKGNQDDGRPPNQQVDLNRMSFYNNVLKDQAYQGAAPDQVQPAGENSVSMRLVRASSKDSPYKQQGVAPLTPNKGTNVNISKLIESQNPLKAFLQKEVQDASQPQAQQPSTAAVMRKSFQQQWPAAQGFAQARDKHGQIPVKTVYGAAHQGGPPALNHQVEMSFADQESYASRISSPVSNSFSQSSRSAQTPQLHSSKRRSNKLTLAQQVELMQQKAMPPMRTDRRQNNPKHDMVEPISEQPKKVVATPIAKPMPDSSPYSKPEKPIQSPLKAQSPVKHRRMTRNKSENIFVAPQVVLKKQRPLLSRKDPTRGMNSQFSQPLLLQPQQAPQQSERVQRISQQCLPQAKVQNFDNTGSAPHLIRQQDTEPGQNRKASLRTTQGDAIGDAIPQEPESQFQQRVREMLNNLPTTTRNRERFTINRTTIKKAKNKLVDPFAHLKVQHQDSASTANAVAQHRQSNDQELEDLINLTQTVNETIVMPMSDHHLLQYTQGTSGVAMRHSADPSSGGHMHSHRMHSTETSRSRKSNEDRGAIFSKRLSPQKMSSTSAQKGRRNLPTLSPRVKQLHQYQKLLYNNNPSGTEQNNAKMGLIYPASIGAQSLAQLPKQSDLSHTNEQSLLTETTQQLPSIKKSFSQHKLSSRQRFVMQKYNLPIPDPTPLQQQHEASNASLTKNMPLRTIQAGVAPVRIQHSNLGLRHSNNLSTSQDQLNSDYSTWLRQPSGHDSEFFIVNSSDHLSSFRQHNLPTRAGTEFRLSTQGSCCMTHDRMGLESQDQQRISNAVMLLQKAQVQHQQNQNLHNQRRQSREIRVLQSKPQSRNSTNQSQLSHQMPPKQALTQVHSSSKHHHQQQRHSGVSEVDDYHHSGAQTLAVDQGDSYNQKKICMRNLQNLFNHSSVHSGERTLEHSAHSSIFQSQRQSKAQQSQNLQRKSHQSRQMLRKSSTQNKPSHSLSTHQHQQMLQPQTGQYELIGTFGGQEDAFYQHDLLDHQQQHVSVLHSLVPSAEITGQQQGFQRIASQQNLAQSSCVTLNAQIQNNHNHNHMQMQSSLTNTREGVKPAETPKKRPTYLQQSSNLALQQPHQKTQHGRSQQF